MLEYPVPVGIPMTGKAKSRARNGSGSLLLRGTIWNARGRELRRNPDGSSESIFYGESTGSDEKNIPQRFLNRKPQEAGGRRPTVLDPKKAPYEGLRQKRLVSREEMGNRSLKYDKTGQVRHSTPPRLDKFFEGHAALKSPLLICACIERMAKKRVWVMLV